MTTQVTTLPKGLQSWVSDWVTKQRVANSPPGPIGGDDVRLEPLAGDGSPRPFFRVHATGTTGEKTFVLLFEPEWTLSKDYPPHQAYLKRLGIPVPEFFEVDPEHGILVMEDLGDELLQHRILAAPTSKMKWLESTAVLLARLHGRAYPVPPELPISSRRFDREKYRAEFEFTIEHLARGFLKIGTPPEKALKALDGFCASLEKIGPVGFSHRDYHTRNVLLSRESLYLIDFQDARLGPIHYDLASLLYDPYVPLTAEERKKLVATYRNELAPFPIAGLIDDATFASDLSRVGYQRMVKAAGSFASFFTRYGKDTHLPYLVPALKTALELERTGIEVPRECFPIESWISLIQARASAKGAS